MNTRRNIMLIVAGVVLLGVAVAFGVISWLGLLHGGLVVLAALALAIGLYFFVIRSWQLRWGATDEEVAREMPGDGLVPAAGSTTRAITMAATPEGVWPWLVQIGYGKAGWYSYDWIDNDGRPSADRILPEYQDLHLGDRIEMMPGFGPTVVTLVSGRVIVSLADDRTSSWCLALYPLEDGRTRLVSRWRVNFKITPATALMIVLSEPGAFIMEQKMLRGIRARAER